MRLCQNRRSLIVFSPKPTLLKRLNPLRNCVEYIGRKCFFYDAIFSNVAGGTVLEEVVEPIATFDACLWITRQSASQSAEIGVRVNLLILCPIEGKHGALYCR